MQRDLFDDPPHDAFARSTDPDTSHAAAASMSPEEILKVEDKIWEYIHTFRPFLGGTQDEVCDATGLPVQTATPRWTSMIRKKRLERRIDPTTGKEHKRRGRAGRMQLVHFAIRKRPE